MAINPANPVGYGKAFQSSTQAGKAFKKKSRMIKARRYAITALWLKGWNYQEMADEFNVSLDTIKRDLRVVNYQFLNGGLLNVGQVMVKSMARIEFLIDYGLDKLKKLPKHQTGGKLMEEIRKCVEFEAKIMGAGEYNTRNLRVKSITQDLTKEQLDKVVEVSLNNEFEKLIELTEESGDLLDVVQAAQS